MPSITGRVGSGCAEAAAHDRQARLALDTGEGAERGQAADRISRAEIERMRDAVAAGKTAEKVTERRAGSIAKGGKGAAAQCVALVSTILGFAVTRGLRTDNPARGVKKAPVRKVERFLSEAEIGRLAEALDGETARSRNPYPSAAIKLLLLTGCRRGEIVNLCWQQVDFERECLRLADRKTGAKVVYLNAPARAVLQDLPRIAGNPRIIP